MSEDLNQIYCGRSVDMNVKASRIFPKDHRGFRSYVRLRHELVQKEQIKNEAHAILAPEMFNLKEVLTDIFGKNGISILSGYFCPTPPKCIFGNEKYKISSLSRNLKFDF